MVATGLIRTSMKIGIVGLPNVGKSTLFKALTKKTVDCANYPFCTIEPNVGVVAVPDERLDKLAAISRSEKIIPTVIEFVDIAGLVRGAHQGEGLGNQFLSHIREVDAIVEVVRIFKDPQVIHVSGALDPKNDIEIISLELVMADLKTVERRYEEASSQAKGGDKEAIRLEVLLKKIKQALNQGQWARGMISEGEAVLIRDLHLLTMKPVLYLLNDDESLSQAGQFSELKPQIIVSAKIESELVDLTPSEAREMMITLGLKESGLDKLIVASYQLLDLITFFTSGPKETRAWTVRRATRAPQAAGVIHSDFEKGFIRAEVMGWQDLVSFGEVGVRERGLLRLEGKEYQIQDGDVCYFRFSV